MSAQSLLEVFLSMGLLNAQLLVEASSASVIGNPMEMNTQFPLSFWALSEIL